MKIYFLDINKEIILEWKKYFDYTYDVEVIHDDFINFMQSHNVDCVVSPGNSHGVMAGGYDRAISEYFGWDLTKNVQKYINEKFGGTQPVGTSFIFPTSKHGVWLIHTPSMEVPSKINNPDVIYNCTKSTIDCAIDNNINEIVIPAFGGLCGGVPPNILCKKMWDAYNDSNVNSI